jgi:hypothetical protein
MYAGQQADFIRHFVGSDSELTDVFNRTFGTNVSKAALRKKRQRMGISKTAEQFRVERMALMGHSPEEIQDSLVSDPPRDIYAEQKEYAAAVRLLGEAPVDIAEQKPSEFWG